MFETKTRLLAPSGTKGGLPSPRTNGSRNILGVRVIEFSKSDALLYIATAIERKQHTKIAFLNAHGANIAWSDQDYLNDLAGFKVLADGIGVDVGSLINYGDKFPDNLNGTDFIPALFDSLKPGVSVALLGAKPGIAELAVSKMKAKYPQLDYNVVGDGYFATRSEAEVISALSVSKPDILLVALGNPAQEKWIAKNCTKDNCTVALGVGAYFDFAAGVIPRAPDIFRKLRLEWAYRLWLEPRRMWRRYMIGNPLFVIRSIMQKLGFKKLKAQKPGADER